MQNSRKTTVNMNPAIKQFKSLINFDKNSLFKKGQSADGKFSNVPIFEADEDGENSSKSSNSSQSSHSMSSDEIKNEDKKI